MLDSVAKLQFVKLSADALSDGTATKGGNGGDKLASPWPVRNGTAGKYPLKDVSVVKTEVPAGGLESVRWSGADVIWLEEAVRSRLAVLDGGRGSAGQLSVGGDSASGAMRLRRFLLSVLQGVSSSGPVNWMKHEPDGFYGWLKSADVLSVTGTVIKVHGSGLVSNVVPMTFGGPEGSASLSFGPGTSDAISRGFDRYSDAVDGGPGSGWARFTKAVKRDFLSPDVMFGWHLSGGKPVQDPGRAYGPLPTPRQMAALYSDLESCHVCAVAPRSTRIGSGPELSAPAENIVTTTVHAEVQYHVESIPGTGTVTGEFECAGGPCDGSPCVSGTYEGSVSPGGYVAQEEVRHGYDVDYDPETGEPVPEDTSEGSSEITRVSVSSSVEVWDGTMDSLKTIAKEFCTGGVWSDARVADWEISTRIDGARGVVGTQLASFSDSSYSNQLITASGIIPVHSDKTVRGRTVSGSLVMDFYTDKDAGFPLEVEVNSVKVLAVVGHVSASRSQSMDSVAPQPTVVTNGEGRASDYTVLSSGGTGGEICECDDDGAAPWDDTLNQFDEDGNLIYVGEYSTPSTVCGQAGSFSDNIEAYPDVGTVSFEPRASESRQLDMEVYVKTVKNAVFDKSTGRVTINNVAGVVRGGRPGGGGSFGISVPMSSPGDFYGCATSQYRPPDNGDVTLGHVTAKTSADYTALLAVGPVIFDVDFKNTSLKQ